ncbi:hypothetical protein J1N35_041436 [Gossypium stocksii]|uniref:Uncharacterized protein n=1 Tax=Gossypium stocksii TaxID=47602 RepID=A0A9D3UG04_9ROSI|nr:hypothetical protein J1N35_041436 [Gossypium stocksii]
MNQNGSRLSASPLQNVLGEYLQVTIRDQSVYRKKAKSYEFDFWEIVKAITERKWEDKVANLKKEDEKAVNELMSKSPKH